MSNPKVITLVLYKADWCPHCQALKPEFDRASRTIRRDTQAQVKVFDSDQHPLEIQRRGIQGFPTIELVRPSGERIAYQGDRSSQSLIDFVRSHATQKPRKASKKGRKRSTKGRKGSKKGRKGSKKGRKGSKKGRKG